jgi:biopolymer transport protein ExbD
MTPMIDMTFLLVVFFMLTIDLTSKEFVPVALPFASQGIEDGAEDADVPRLVINLEKSGLATFKRQSYRLSSEDGLLQSRALSALTRALQLHTTDPRYRDDQGHTAIPVLIHADRGTKWQYVQWLLQVCSEADVGIYRVQFAVKQPTRGEETASDENKEPRLRKEDR